MDVIVGKAFDEARDCFDITLNGEIEIYNSDSFKEVVKLIIEERKSNICFNCAMLKYIDSTALGAFVSILKAVKTYNKDVILKDVPPNIMKLFKITNLDQIFVIEGEKHD